ncbi:MAG TPA: hypothetical protein VMM18_16960 [Gemmatimonadaceae bacterium]|nr:hypothetical protein [Gemmatimonadaceae bacterium]
MSAVIRSGEAGENTTRFQRSRVALAVLFLLLSLNAWMQAADAALGRSIEPRALTLLQVLVGATAIAAAYGSWSGARWAPWAAVAWGVVTAGLILALDPLLQLAPEARRGLLIGGAVVLVLGGAAGWFLRRAVARRPAGTPPPAD